MTPSSKKNASTEPACPTACNASAPAPSNKYGDRILIPRFSSRRTILRLVLPGFPNRRPPQHPRVCDIDVEPFEGVTATGRERRESGGSSAFVVTLPAGRGSVFVTLLHAFHF